MATTIRIAVKGDTGDAERAMRERGVTGAWRPSDSAWETFWDVDEGQRALLVAWFCESGACPPGGFPAGTLLHHS